MSKLKFIVCVIINVAFFTLSIIGYNNISRNAEIVKMQSPITVKILDITYRAKSKSTCKVEFNNKTYDDINLPPGTKINSVNSVDFYYDAKRDSVFYKNESVGAIYVVIALSFLSLLLWLIPKEKFKW